MTTTGRSNGPASHYVEDQIRKLQKRIVLGGACEEVLRAERFHVARSVSGMATVRTDAEAAGRTISGVCVETLALSVHFITHKFTSDTDVSQQSCSLLAANADVADMLASMQGRAANAACVKSSMPISTWHMAAVSLR